MCGIQREADLFIFIFIFDIPPLARQFGVEFRCVPVAEYSALLKKDLFLPHPPIIINENADIL